MVDACEIETLVEKIVQAFKPERVILFGSYAYGIPTEDSDVDLLVVRRHRGPSHHAASRIRHAIDIHLPLDIIVRSPAEIRQRLAWGDYFIMDIIEEGIVLYESDDRRVGEQGPRRLRRRLNSAALAKAESV